MKKILSLLAIMAFATIPTFAQHGKKVPPATGTISEQPQVSWPGKAVVPTAQSPFSTATPKQQPLPMLQPLSGTEHPNVAIVRGENGLPIFFEGKTQASGSAAESAPMNERALAYCASLRPQGIKQPENEFVVSTQHEDEQGNTHVRLEQIFNGLPVWGGELICHTKNGAFERMNGRYFPTPQLTSLTPSLSAEQAMLTVKSEIGEANIKTDWTEADLKLIDGQPFSARLIVFHPNEKPGGERLCWHVAARPNVLSRSEWFVDALTGEILNSFEHTCNLLGHYQSHVCKENNTLTIGEMEHEPAQNQSNTMMDGPVTVNGLDLFDINRSFTQGGWQFGNQYTLEDASKPMFNASASNMPGDPVGAIVTLDGGNTSPGTQNFNLNLVTSGSPTFTNKKAAISAHYNAITSYNYFRSKFNRNSINGVGGNVISVVNVTEPNGTSMENAFWNGQAMFYGNGGSVFKPLARGLDVGGHEMTHGVVEKTANLVYQNESGALNESFSDIFGHLIEGDPNDWKIGEDVMQSGGGLPTALRDMQNPHNGQPVGSNFWQPKHTNEQYTGTQDNGGVHINSGIVNHAYYLFATNAAVGSQKAEQVYYKALRDYLVKSSKFVDCRLAVIQAATDLYGAAEANAAANAFAQVGIGGSAPSGNYLGQLSPNPGQDYILCTSNNGNNLDLALGNGQVLGSMYTQGVASRPSITDNGASLVFVNDAGHIIGIDLTYQPAITYTTSQLSVTAEWRNVAISKDGRFIAALADFQQPRIYIFDLASPFGDFETMFLYNPTYTQGQITGDVRYADVLEFDYSGKYLMYDAYNQLGNIGYWDIGFVKFWENNDFVDGGNAFITKLFSGLPEKVSIGNPTFAKNSPFIIAFDLIDEVSAVRYDIYGANSETGDYDIIVANNGDLGWPNYNRLDTRLIYDKPTNFGFDIRSQGLNANKIQPSGGSSLQVSAHYWGVWYGNGTRNLLLDANDVQQQRFEAKIAPNPTADFAQLSLYSETSNAAQISLHSLLGETLLTRSVQLNAGQNQLDLDLQHLPSGTYLVRIAADNGSGAVLKVVKQ